MQKTTNAIAMAALISIIFAGCVGSTGGDAGDNPFPIPTQAVTIAGSGATFPKPLLETWGIEFAQYHPTVQVSYAGGGSGKGIKDVSEKTVLFAGSDAPMSAAERQNVANILHIPETLGLLAVVYNVESVADGLKLDGEVVGKIYTGEIKKWNDPAIAALNPGVTLPDATIAIVYRSDSSGTTYVFTDWLRKTSESWKSVMGTAPTKKPDWTKSSATSLSGNGNDGVGTTVDTTPNSIGYVELAFVKNLGLKAARLKSHDGAFLSPTTQGAAAAAASAAKTLPGPLNDWSAVSITDNAGEGSYPISSFTYILVYKSASDYGGRFSQNELDGFKAWLWWGLHDGQGRSEGLGYAPLPDPVVKLGEDALSSMS
jgi:phosphate transport system substrate-binding protein